MQYLFVYSGHEYTKSERAEHQGKCPHCGEPAPDGNFYQAYDDSFLGYKKLDDRFSAFCFECPKCFEKFWYHQSNDMIEELVKNAIFFRNKRKV